MSLRTDIEAIALEMKRDMGGPAFTPFAVVYAKIERALYMEDRRQSATWLHEHEDINPTAYETIDAARCHVRVLLGRSPTAEDWDRIPDLVAKVLREEE